MGRKTKCLDELVSEKLNVFEYKEIKKYDDLIEYSKSNEIFTIRFDSEKVIHNLPFYKYNNDLDLKKIFDEATSIGCTLLCSNGYKYDKDLIFNFVIDIDSNNDYILELSSQKVPLREMYKNKTTIIKGNIFDDGYHVYQKNDEFSIRDINTIIDFVINNEIKYKYIEGTMYPINVGIYNKKMIIWQTLK